MLKLDKFQSILPDQECVSIAPTSSIRIWPPIMFSKIQKIRNPKNNRNRQPKFHQTSLLETLHRSRELKTPFFFKEKKIIFLLNAHYNGLIVIMKILFVSPIILFKEMEVLILLVLEVLLLDQL